MSTALMPTQASGRRSTCWPGVGRRRSQAIKPRRLLQRRRGAAARRRRRRADFRRRRWRARRSAIWPGKRQPQRAGPRQAAGGIGCRPKARASGNPPRFVPRPRVVISHTTGTRARGPMSSNSAGVASAGTTPTDSSATAPDVAAAERGERRRRWRRAAPPAARAAGASRASHSARSALVANTSRPSGTALPPSNDRRGLVALGRAALSRCTRARPSITSPRRALSCVAQRALDVGLGGDRQHGGFGQRLERHGPVDAAAGSQRVARRSSAARTTRLTSARAGAPA